MRTVVGRTGLRLLGSGAPEACQDFEGGGCEGGTLKDADASTHATGIQGQADVPKSIRHRDLALAEASPLPPPTVILPPGLTLNMCPFEAQSVHGRPAWAGTR